MPSLVNGVAPDYPVAQSCWAGFATPKTVSICGPMCICAGPSISGSIFPHLQMRYTFGISHFCLRLGRLEEPLVEPCKGCPAYIGLLRTGPVQGRSKGGVVWRVQRGPDPTLPLVSFPGGRTPCTKWALALPLEIASLTPHIS